MIKYRIKCVYRKALPGHSYADPYLDEKTWLVKDGITNKNYAVDLCSKLNEKDAWGMENLNSPGKRYFMEEYNG